MASAAQSTRRSRDFARDEVARLRYLEVDMITRSIGIPCFLLSLTTTPMLLAQGKGGGKCASVPIRVTLLPLPSGGPESVLQGDGSDSWQDGQNGVSARIHVCGSGDATITTMGKSFTRKIRIAFPQVLEGSSLSGQVPSWAGTAIQVAFFFNIRNIPCFEGNCGDTFTTRMNWQFTGPDGRDYRWRLYPAEADAPDLHSPEMLNEEPNINQPYETSYVQIHHRPGNCADPNANPRV